MGDAAEVARAHLFQLLGDRASASRDSVALRSKRGGRWTSTSWREWHDASQAISAALLDAGLELGDRVVLLSGTREEWLIVDFGILGAGAVTVPIYPTSTREQIGFVLSHCGARWAFVESADQLSELRAAAESATELERVVVLDSAASRKPIARATGSPIEVTHYLDFMKRAVAHGSSAETVDALEARQSELRPESLATVVYTSGTTGTPRGAMLSHANLLAEADALTEAIVVGSDDEHLSFLPLAHIFARVVALAAVQAGARTAFAEGMHRVIDNFAEVRPTFFASVPRLFEKVFAVANETAGAEGPVKERLWRWAMGLGLQASRLRQKGEAPSTLLAARLRYAQKIALEKVRQRFGGRLRFAVSGGAPLSRELAEWFDAIGILVLEGYGLTEASGCSHVNRLDRYRFGSVGLPIAGVETKLGKDGEVLLKGPTIMQGFFGQPEATAEVLDQDGWLHTGDIGELGADGFLTIVDRKKDLIVTAGGSNVAPQNIERMLAQSPWIHQAVVFGDRERYLVALVTLDLSTVKRWAADHRRGSDPAALARDPELRALIQLDVDDVNRRLSRFEQIRKFSILERELSIAEGELTETLKPRRDQIREHHDAVIRVMYDASAPFHPPPSERP